MAERFLFGDTCADPVLAHQIVKAVFEGGKRRYPTLWDKAEKYVHGHEFPSLEKIAALPSGSPIKQLNNVTIQDSIMKNTSENLSIEMDSQMNYVAFCAKAQALLGSYPALTGLRMGAGYMLLDEDKNFLAVKEGGNVEDVIDVDDSTWDGQGFEGITAQEISQAFAKPEFHQFLSQEALVNQALEKKQDRPDMCMEVGAMFGLDVPGAQLKIPGVPVQTANAKYGHTIIGTRVDQYDAFEIHGVRDLNLGNAEAGTQFEVEFENPEMYSVYAHLKDGEVECVGDMPTHALAVDYADLMSKRYGLGVKDLSKTGVVASVLEAREMAREKGPGVLIDANITRFLTGKVMGVTQAHVVLSLGRSAVIVAQSKLSRVPLYGEDVSMAFKDGKGVVSNRVVEKDSSLGR